MAERLAEARVVVEPKVHWLIVTRNPELYEQGILKHGGQAKGFGPSRMGDAVVRARSSGSLIDRSVVVDREEQRRASLIGHIHAGLQVVVGVDPSIVIPIEPRDVHLAVVGTGQHGAIPGPKQQLLKSESDREVDVLFQQVDSPGRAPMDRARLRTTMSGVDRNDRLGCEAALIRGDRWARLGGVVSRTLGKGTCQGRRRLDNQHRGSGEQEQAFQSHTRGVHTSHRSFCKPRSAGHYKWCENLRMCGRFGEEQEYVALSRRYQAVLRAVDPGPRYNVAPTQPAAVIVQNGGERSLVHHRWGLVPHFARDVSIGARMINARAETLTQQPAFREAFEERRCVIPATRFYEWRRDGRARIPFSILRNDGAPLNFAGLWASWRDRGTGERVLSFTIVTTASNGLISPLHDRMPAILDDEAVAAWLDPNLDAATLQAFLVPYPDSDDLFMYRVPLLVNNANNEGPELIAAIA